MKPIPLFENESDDKVGKEFWFEYHCLESPASGDEFYRPDPPAKKELKK